MRPTVQSNARRSPPTDRAQATNARLLQRRGRDSNPRGGSTPPTRFPIALLKPLGHLSVPGRRVASGHLDGRPIANRRKVDLTRGDGSSERPASTARPKGRKQRRGRIPGTPSRCWRRAAGGGSLALVNAFPFPTYTGFAMGGEVVSLDRARA